MGPQSGLMSVKGFLGDPAQGQAELHAQTNAAMSLIVAEMSTTSTTKQVYKKFQDQYKVSGAPAASCSQDPKHSIGMVKLHLRELVGIGRKGYSFSFKYAHRPTEEERTPRSHGRGRNTRLPESP